MSMQEKKERYKCFLLLHLFFILPILAEMIRVRKQLLFQCFQPQGINLIHNQRTNSSIPLSPPLPTLFLPPPVTYNDD